MLAYEPAKRLARLNIELNSALVGVRVLFEIIDTPPTEPNDDDDKPALKISTARVDFNDVRFGYRPGEVVMHGMTFTAEPGRMTALVGPSGGGKSTVFNLMLRFYEVDGGTIMIDGQNIASVSRRSLRRQIAYVGQDVFLFHGTIRDNIAVGKPGASEDEIVAAAKAAHAHEFITGFPAGYDTPVGERGTQLSGGERQRIAIARALIKNAPIILLDEATASLDSESERLVQDAMAHLCEGRTTIAIAHRLHTIMHADRILVVESGAIVESGRHDELLRKGGRYAAFYRLQIKEEQQSPAADFDRLGVTRILCRCADEMPFPALTWKAHVLSGCPPGPIRPVKRFSGSPSIPQPKQQHEQRQALRHSPAAAGGARDRRIERPVSRSAGSGASAATTWSTSRRWDRTSASRRSSSPSPPMRSCPTAAPSPYPPLTKDMHHEVELVVALKSGGRNIPTEKALDCVWGYGVGIDLTRRDLQIASRDIKRPWEIGKAFDASAPCGPLMPVEPDRPSEQRPHRAQVQRQGAPGRRSRSR